MITETPTPTPGPLRRGPASHRFHPASAARLLAAVGSVIGAAIAVSAPVNADPGTATVLNEIGIGNNGAISQVIAQFATSLCPMLVQPGSQLASTATTASGNGGLGSQIAGGVAGIAIQTQCPNFMTSLANGDFTVLSNAASMMGIANSGANPLSAIGTTGANPLSAIGSP